MLPEPSPIASSEHRQRLLASRPFLRGLAPAILGDLDAAFESVHVRGGEKVVESGQKDAPLLMVVHGGLRASYAGGDGKRHVVLECFRGGTIGEALLLGGCASPLDVHAVRDSHLLCLGADRFRELAAKHPELTLRLAHTLATRVVDLYRSTEFLSSFSRHADRLPRSIVLLAAGGRDALGTRDLLALALARSCRATRLDSDAARETLRRLPGHDGSPAELCLAEWFSRHESRSELAVLECEASDGPWLDFCLRQADRIMVVAQEDVGREALEREVWQKAGLGGSSARVELAIVHPSTQGLPRGGAAYLGLPGLARLHHVRATDPGDALRLARWLVDRPVGLVLSGGGAFGIAHVGVLKALEEFGVPVDVIGGTSMGAIFGGGRALGLSADAIMDQVRALFSSRFALYDPTIPLRALLAGKKLDRVLRGFFDDVDFADLWTPLFCVSTNISHARCEVHATGDVWSAIRSSCSIPGVFPPYSTLQKLRVDGGLVDNLPLDIMAERCRGPIVVVDVSPYQRSSNDAERRAPRLRERLRRLAPNLCGGPYLVEILMRATFAGSQYRTELSLSGHPPALYLVPPLGRFRILDWRAYEALFEAGYTSARQEMESGKLPRRLWEGPLEDVAV